MSEYVTAEDLDVPDCECGHHAGKHWAVPHRYSARLVECECRKTTDDLSLAHVESIVRREVAKALRVTQDKLLMLSGFLDGDDTPQDALDMARRVVELHAEGFEKRDGGSVSSGHLPPLLAPPTGDAEDNATTKSGGQS